MKVWSETEKFSKADKKETAVLHCLTITLLNPNIWPSLYFSSLVTV